LTFAHVKPANPGFGAGSAHFHFLFWYPDPGCCGLPKKL
jgi:hypothetical protein